MMYLCPEEITYLIENNATDPYVITGIFIGLIILVILTYEIWALKNHKPTVSKWFQKYSQKWKFFGGLVISGLLILMIHWTKGFDLHGIQSKFLERIKSFKK